MSVGAEVTCAVSDPQGRRTVVGTSDGVVALRGGLIFDEIASAVACAPMPARLASGTKERSGAAEVTAVAFVGSAGLLVASTFDGDLLVYDATARAVREHHVESKKPKEMDAHPHQGVAAPKTDRDMEVEAAKNAIASAQAVTSAHSPELPLLRSVAVAHGGGAISKLSCSAHLSLVATAGGGSSVLVWDFASLTLCDVLPHGAGDVSSLAFLDPLPALLTADSDGTLRLWPVRPHLLANAGRPLAVWRNRIAPPPEPSAHGNPHHEAQLLLPGISSLLVSWIVPPVRGGEHGGVRCLVTCGSDTGVIAVWNVTPVLRAVGLLMNALGASQEDSRVSKRSDDGPPRKESTSFDDYVDDAPIIAALTATPLEATYAASLGARACHDVTKGRGGRGEGNPDDVGTDVESALLRTTFMKEEASTDQSKSVPSLGAPQLHTHGAFKGRTTKGHEIWAPAWSPQLAQATLLPIRLGDDRQRVTRVGATHGVSGAKLARLQKLLGHNSGDRSVDHGAVVFDPGSDDRSTFKWLPSARPKLLHTFKAHDDAVTGLSQTIELQDEYTSAKGWAILRVGFALVTFYFRLFFMSTVLPSLAPGGGF